MNFPNFNEEKKLWKQGFNFVVGLDEAGRGPLAGPVVAAAVMLIINNKKHSHILKNVRMLGIRDSKKLSPKQREFFYRILTNHKNIKWGIGIVSEKVIDKINILEATKLAMQKALNNLNLSLKKGKNKSVIINGRRLLQTGVGFLLIDGNFVLNLEIAQKSIIKGDEKVFSCMAAGIIAKVTRDRIMQKLHKRYPQYGFTFHKGYPTSLHVKNLKSLGPCKIHRKTFYPVSDFM